MSCIILQSSVSRQWTQQQEFRLKYQGIQVLEEKMAQTLGKFFLQWYAKVNLRTLTLKGSVRPDELGVKSWLNR